MGKKKTTKKSSPKRKSPRQTHIPGTHDPVPAELEATADTYVRTLRQRQKAQFKESALRVDVIDLMHKYDLQRVPLNDGSDKVLVLDNSERIKITKPEEVKV